MNRRTILKGAAGFGFLGTVPLLARAQPVELTPVAVATPSGTPTVDLPIYEGPVSDIWAQPWETEGFLVQFDGVILQRFIGTDSKGYAAGRDELRFRSLLHLDVVDEEGFERDLFVATNGDLHEIEDQFTAHIVGQFAGKHDYQRGGGWTVPLIVAAKISSAKDASP